MASSSDPGSVRARGGTHLSDRDKQLSDELSLALSKHPDETVRVCNRLSSDLSRCPSEASARSALARALRRSTSDPALYSYAEWVKAFGCVDRLWVARNYVKRPAPLMAQALVVRQLMYTVLSEFDSDFASAHDVDPVSRVRFCIMTTEPDPPDPLWTARQATAFALVDPRLHTDPGADSRGDIWWGLKVLERVSQTCGEEDTKHLLTVAAEIAERYRYCTPSAPSGHGAAHDSSRSDRPTLSRDQLGNGEVWREKRANKLSDDWRSTKTPQPAMTVPAATAPPTELLSPRLTDRKVAASVIKDAENSSIHMPLTDLLTALRVYVRLREGGLLWSDRAQATAENLATVTDLLVSRRDVQAVKDRGVQLYSAVPRREPDPQEERESAGWTWAGRIANEQSTMVACHSSFRGR